MSSLLVRLSRPRHPRVGQAIIPDPEMMDYFFEEYQLGSVTRSLIRSDPPINGVSQRLPLGTEGPKKQDGLVGPMEVWLMHDLLNDLMR